MSLSCVVFATCVAPLTLLSAEDSQQRKSVVAVAGKRPAETQQPAFMLPSERLVAEASTPAPTPFVLPSQRLMEAVRDDPPPPALPVAPSPAGGSPLPPAPVVTSPAGTPTVQRRAPLPKPPIRPSMPPKDET